MTTVRFDDRVVVITGAAGGLGRRVAEALAARGAALALFDRDGAAAEALATSLTSAGGRAAAFVVDVRSLASLEAGFAAAADEFGGIDIVLAGAGIDRMAPLETQSADDFEATIDINLTGVWRTLRAGLPYVRQRRGYLLAVSSMAAFVHSPLQGAYSASKAGVLALANSLRLEVAGDGVAVGTLHPTFFHTPLFDEMVARPEGALVWAGNRGPIWKPVAIEAVVDATLRAMRRRARLVTVPGHQRPVAWMAGLLRRPLEWLGFSRRRIGQAMRAAARSR